jgi:2-polyprenyl-6-hydroxyphenyl methylase/3-demethylubiquinone-9 3-methyltransferase
MLPRGTHDYERFIKPSELSATSRRAGLEIVDLIGMTYNPFTKVYALGADTDVNYILSTRKPAHS